jgi:hypothetical protein
VRLLGADDGAGNDRCTLAQGQPNVATTPEALELITLAVELADALHTFGKHSHDALFREQALGVFLASAHGADAVHEDAGER